MNNRATILKIPSQNIRSHGKSIPAILKNLEKLNHKKRIKIRYKKLNDSYSLYLDIWNNGKREYQILKLVLG